MDRVNVSEPALDAAFIASDLGDRSYETVKLAGLVDAIEASTPLARDAAGHVVPAGAGLVAQPATQTFAGFLVARVKPGFGAERVLGTNLARDAEVFEDRIAFPAGADAPATAAIREAIVEAAEARGILFRNR